MLRRAHVLFIFGFLSLCLQEQNSESRCLIQSILGVLFSFLLHLIPCVHLYRLLWVGDLYKGNFLFLMCHVLIYRYFSIANWDVFMMCYSTCFLFNGVHFRLDLGVIRIFTCSNPEYRWESTYCKQWNWSSTWTNPSECICGWCTVNAEKHNNPIDLHFPLSSSPTFKHPPPASSPSPLHQRDIEWVSFHTLIIKIEAVTKWTADVSRLRSRFLGFHSIFPVLLL